MSARWRSVPMGPLVFGETEGFVTFVTKGLPFRAHWGKEEISAHTSVAEAQRSVERVALAKARGE